MSHGSLTEHAKGFGFHLGHLQSKKSQVTGAVKGLSLPIRVSVNAKVDK